MGYLPVFTLPPLDPPFLLPPWVDREKSMKRSPFWLFSIFEEGMRYFRGKSKAAPTQIVEDAESWTFEEWRVAQDAFRDLGQVLRFVDPVRELPLVRLVYRRRRRGFKGAPKVQSSSFGRPTVF